MRQILLSTLAFAALTSASLAGDLAAPRATPIFLAPPPSYSWSGFNIGADIGGGLANLNANTSFGAYNASASGPVGGGRIGYAYQYDHLVFGAEGDFYGAGISNNKYVSLFDTRINRNQDWLAAINGRFGYASYRTLFYALGGVAFTQGSNTFTAGTLLAPMLAGGGLATRVGVTHNYTGFDVGAGVEYGFADNWLGRLEYRYYGFGSWNYPGNVWIQQTQASLNDSVVTLGLSYKFGAADPLVIAKY
jgi:outer membrane immunogenic protein